VENSFCHLRSSPRASCVVRVRRRPDARREDELAKTNCGCVVDHCRICKFQNASKVGDDKRERNAAHPWRSPLFQRLHVFEVWAKCPSLAYAVMPNGCSETPQGCRPSNGLRTTILMQGSHYMIYFISMNSFLSRNFARW
jgi:hypothetical protein